MKKLLSLFLGLLLSLTAAGCAEPEMEARPGTQDEVITAYNELLTAFGTPLPHEPGYPGYPEEFGDAYLEDGCLVICLTENTRKMRDAYRDRVSQPELLCFVEVEHSYNNLYALQMALNAADPIDGIASYGVDVMENCLSVGIPDLSNTEDILAQIEARLPQEVRDLFDELPVSIHQEDYFVPA